MRDLNRMMSLNNQLNALSIAQDVLSKHIVVTTLNEAQLETLGNVTGNMNRLGKLFHTSLDELVRNEGIGNAN